MYKDPVKLRAFMDRKNEKRNADRLQNREEINAENRSKYACLTKEERRALVHPRIAEYKRRTRLKANFGLSKEEYAEMLAAQDGKCAICRQSEYVMVSNPYMKPKVRNLAVDHNHETGQVRALLCTLCNGIVGFCRESPEVLKSCIAYLQDHAPEVEKAV